MLLETILYISGVFLCIESLQRCFHSSQERHELYPIYIQTIRSDDIDMETIAPLTQEHIEDQLCSICLEPFQEIKPIRTLPCGHYYCESCILAWLKTSTKCPLCNQNCVQLWMTQRQESVSIS